MSKPNYYVQLTDSPTSQELSPSPQQLQYSPQLPNGQGYQVPQQYQAPQQQYQSPQQQYQSPQQQYQVPQQQYQVPQQQYQGGPPPQGQRFAYPLAGFDMTPANGLLDEVNYPKSARLYRELVAAYGEANIVKLPQFLSGIDDKWRVNWYKRDANAWLYFQHKSPKYKQRIAQIANLGLCSCCSYYGLLKKYYKQEFSCDAPPMVECYNQWFVAVNTCCCLYESVGIHSYLFYGHQLRNDQINGCCACFEYAKLRKDIFAALGRSGVLTPSEADPCCNCLTVFCCSPCAVAQVRAILDYWLLKRYGVGYGYGDETAFSTLPQELQNYHRATWNLTAQDPSQPWFARPPFWLITDRDKTFPPDIDTRNCCGCKLDYVDVAQPFRMRESFAEFFLPPDEAFAEWTRTDQSRNAFNLRWTGVHQIRPGIAM